MIEKIGRKWVLLSGDGRKVLGAHSTKAQALSQERAIQISKSRRAGYRIPRKRS